MLYKSNLLLWLKDLLGKSEIRLKEMLWKIGKPEHQGEKNETEKTEHVSRRFTEKKYIQIIKEQQQQ